MPISFYSYGNMVQLILSCYFRIAANIGYLLIIILTTIHTAKLYSYHIANIEHTTATNLWTQ